MDTITITSSLNAYALAEHRELSEVRLSKEVTSLGRHAFYNCRNLKRLRLSDRLRDIGDGAFKNCGRLSELVITQSKEGSCAALKSILSELSGGFLITFLTIEEGQEEQKTEVLSENSRKSNQNQRTEQKITEKIRNCIYIPSYLHDYEENTEARIINQVTYGAGVHYRECIREAGIDYAAYDRLFPRCIPLDAEAAWRVAFYRCAYPWELRSEACRQYRDWLYKNRRQVVEGLCSESETDTIALLRLWLELGFYQSEAEWKEVIDWLHGQENWEAVALFMQGLQRWRTVQVRNQKNRETADIRDMKIEDKRKEEWENRRKRKKFEF